MALRVLILTNRVPYPLNDGGALGMDVFLKGYPEAGCTTRLLAMNTTRHFVDTAKLPAVWPGLEKIRTVPVNNDIRPGGLIRNWLLSREPYHVTRFESDAFSEALQQELHHFQPEVVHIESPFLASYLPIIRNITPTAQTVFRMNNVEAEIWERLAHETAHPVKRYYLKTLSRRMAAYEHKIWPLFDRLLPVTAADAAVAARVVPEARIQVVPFCIDLAAYPVQPWPSAPAGYHLAAMDWLPNVEAVRWFAETVAPLVTQSAPEIPLTFAGRHMPESLKMLASGTLQITGEVADAQTFTADKPILLVPLRSGGGIRVKILEAMASGKLIISTTVGMQGIPVVPGVQALIADTPEAFAQALAKTAAEPAWAQAIAREGRTFVETHFDRSRILAGLVEALQE
jgi:glycosyltransferase involved in cell wall biosynthesis